jgi:hypothetical protein
LKFHVYFLFLVFPGELTLDTARSKKRKKAPREKLPAHDPSFAWCRFWQKLRQPVKRIRRQGSSQIAFQQRCEFFIRAHTGSVDCRIPAVQWPFIGPEKTFDSSLRLLAK